MGDATAPQAQAPAEIFEKLGEFYLGRDYDVDAGEVTRKPTLYDARDLVTHAVCVGMTGSGKTGLCVGLLEEAAIDGVPAIVIDPKGDLGNLLLTFPELQPGDFQPWVSADDARRKNVTVEQLASDTARSWREGLASWGQTPERIQRLRDAADFAIYTPGSSAGLPLSLVKSFAAPPPALRDEPDLFQERIATAVSSLLGLLGIDADPVQSREHILLSSLLAHAWRDGRDLDVPGLIRAVQTPPFTEVGVLDLESFYPERDRRKLSLALNNLVASPAFSAWMTGEPLDIGAMLYGPGGKPRISIVSIAHLGDAERMFFVSLLLNEVLGWVRTQSGTAHLRAIVYMDEIFGYLPPVANPPSKKPLLTLMKQARAFGVSVVLATQNPVDLDYKALSNAGTWFIGRLQTAQDKARLLDALDSASSTAGGSFDRADGDRILSNLGKRVFLLHNVHAGRPTVFQTRWALSYLRGPLVRDEIRALMAPRKEAAAAAAAAATAASAAAIGAAVAPRAQSAATGAAPAPASAAAPAAAAPATSAAPTAAPSLDPAIPQRFAAIAGNRDRFAAIEYRPALLGAATVAFADKRTGALVERPVRCLVTFGDASAPVDWERGISTGLDASALRDAAESVNAFAALPPVATRKASYGSWTTALTDRLYRSERLVRLRSPSTGELSRIDEDERAFRIRLADLMRARRDTEVDRIRASYAPKLRRIDDQIDAANRRVDREQDQASAARLDTVAAFAAPVFDALFGGRRSAARGAATAARKVSRARQQSGDVAEARARLTSLEAERRALAEACERELRAVPDATAAQREVLETTELAPRRADIHGATVTLVWLPVGVNSIGVPSLACDTR